MGIISSHLKIKNYEHKIIQKPLEEKREEQQLPSGWRARRREFIKRGPCKDEYMNFLNIGSVASSDKLDVCMESHSYYQSYLESTKANLKDFMEKATKEILQSDIPLDEIDDEETVKLFAKLVEGACCKESFKTWAVNCFLTDEEIDVYQDSFFLQKPIERKEKVNCKELWVKFYECIDDHPDHPFFAFKKAALEQDDKEGEALFPEPN